MTITTTNGGAEQITLEPWQNLDGDIDARLTREGSLAPVFERLAKDCLTIASEYAPKQVVSEAVRGTELTVCAFDTDPRLALVRAERIGHNPAYAFLSNIAIREGKVEVIRGIATHGLPASHDVELFADGSRQTRLVSTSRKYESTFRTLMRGAHDAASELAAGKNRIDNEWGKEVARFLAASVLEAERQPGHVTAGFRVW